MNTPQPESLSWQIKDDDIELVLLTHKVPAEDADIANARAALNEPAIILRLMLFDTFDVRCDSALSDIEDTLIEDGIIDPNTGKQFDRPAPPPLRAL